MMKKLLTNLLPAVLLYGFTYATPAHCISMVKAYRINKAYVSENYETEAKNEVEFQIHPLDILAFKFR